MNFFINTQLALPWVHAKRGKWYQIKNFLEGRNCQIGTLKIKFYYFEKYLKQLLFFYFGWCKLSGSLFYLKRFQIVPIRFIDILLLGDWAKAEITIDLDVENHLEQLWKPEKNLDWSHALKRIYLKLITFKM